jgi:hypothetical protein
MLQLIISRRQPEGKRLFCQTSSTWKENIKTDVNYKWYEGAGFDSVGSRYGPVLL